MTKTIHKLLYLLSNQFWYRKPLSATLAKTGFKDELSFSEEIQLSAALLNLEMPVLADLLCITLESLKTSVSNGLKKYIREFIYESNEGYIEEQIRIKWSDIPKILKDFRRSNSFLTFQNSQVMLDEISSTGKISEELIARITSIPEPSEQNFAEDIIKKINNRMIEIKIRGKELHVSQEEINEKEEFSNIAERKGNLAKAIEHCRELPEYNPKDRQCIQFLVKICLILNKMGRFAEAAKLALYSLELVHDKDGRSRLHGVLGRAFAEKAQVNLNEEYLRHSIWHYKKSIKRSWGYHFLGIWNSFDLVEACSKQDDKYLSEAKLMFLNVLKLLDSRKTDFNLYQKDIIEDAKKKAESVEDIWLSEQLDNFINKYK